MGKLNRGYVASGAFLVSMLATAGAAFATGPTYDVTPVTTSITSELVANLPVILGIVGALFALAIAIKAVRKFVHV
jgi:hypothetical protein